MMDFKLSTMIAISVRPKLATFAVWLLLASGGGAAAALGGAAAAVTLAAETLETGGRGGSTTSLTSRAGAGAPTGGSSTPVVCYDPIKAERWRNEWIVEDLAMKVAFAVVADARSAELEQNATPSFDICTEQSIMSAPSSTAFW
ncbi:unnamed protein product [Camellia sinensis]